MKQDGSIALFHYWNRLRHGRTAPKRTEIEPADIKTLLADTFILERDTRSEAVFRLAGTRLCAVFGRELKGFSFPSLWQDKDRRLVARLAHGVFESGNVVVIVFEGISGSERSNPLRDDRPAARWRRRQPALPGRGIGRGKALLAWRRPDRRDPDRIRPRGRSRPRADVPEETGRPSTFRLFRRASCPPRGTTRPPVRAGSATSSCSTADAENKPFRVSREDKLTAC